MACCLARCMRRTAIPDRAEIQPCLNGTSSGARLGCPPRCAGGAPNTSDKIREGGTDKTQASARRVMRLI